MAINAQTVKQYYQSNLDEALKKASEILGDPIGESNFNGLVGGKNKTYGVDIKEHDTPESYVKAWIDGHERVYEKDRNLKLSFTKYDRSSYKIQALLEDKFLRGFIECYLIKSYFKNR
ncbi:topoisomerase [Bacillus thuringiensis]|uniref:topoisomerase n=1 Tax=Bacillus thuringiensis TaxID=1428 RepID=UPI000BF41FCD|nr:topoisomerase [Bacillus thuringiensis]PEY71427.1 topoisomerase [Bacillus thuringiensis]PFC49236.1 topoisomerase [Bacillus thuringiensis]